MTETTYLLGRVLKRSLPVFNGSPPPDALGPKRLALAQGELANFYDGDEGIRYVAYIELIEGTVRGNHWHRVKEEKIYVICGELLLFARNLDSSEPAVSINLRQGDLATVAPGVAHALKTIKSGHAIEFSRTKFDPTDIQRFTFVQ